MADSPNSTILSRRALMASAPAVALAAVPVAAVAAAVPAPTDEELTRYYTFLWYELSNLSKEMGVDMLDGYTTIRNDDNRIVRANLGKSPSDRARQALEAAGLEVKRLPGVQRFPIDRGPNW